MPTLAEVLSNNTVILDMTVYEAAAFLQAQLTEQDKTATISIQTDKGHKLTVSFSDSGEE